jgi:predicted amidophosphoribosyltransferase
VPADPVRQLRRGTHPAETLAHELGARWSIDTLSALDRARTTERQAGLPYARRRVNVRRSFTAEESVDGARVLLVDDVYTTGSTVDAAASALRRRGARGVEVVTFARALRR